MLNVSDILTDSVVDGPGIRTTIFFQGCPHHCPKCQNPETWEFGVGTDMSIESILEIVHSNPIVKGVTLSGGEPFAQNGEIVELAKRLKYCGYEVAAYTGFTFEELYSSEVPHRKELLKYLDILVDGPFIQSEKSLELVFKGSKNQRILNVPESLKQGRAILETSERWLGVY